jgi:hypothetical protein
MVKLSRITFTVLTLLVAFLLPFVGARGLRSADLAGASPLCAAPDLEGLLAIERFREQPDAKRDNILYIRFVQIGAMSSLRGIREHG